jgi:beta-1,4-mannosyl-glycoprotein beta-1,4-N-acetylglucosaminyltransferase
MKIIDCFTFYNELDMLQYRLSVLNDVVDTFVLVESTRTFMGKEKSLVYEEHKDTHFAKYSHKIVHVVVDDMPFPNYETLSVENNEQWQNEYHQRNCIDRGIQRIGPNLDDFIVISDVDEIPDPQTLQNIKSGDLQIYTKEEMDSPDMLVIRGLEQDIYYYNLHTRFEQKMTIAKIIAYGFYRKVFDLYARKIHDIRGYLCDYIPRGGWHLSYFGDIQFIRNKLLNFAHAEYSSSDYTSDDAIQTAIEKGLSMFEKDIVIHRISPDKNEYLPPNHTYLIDMVVQDVNVPLDAKVYGIEADAPEWMQHILAEYAVSNPHMYFVYNNRETMQKYIPDYKSHSNIKYISTNTIKGETEFQRLCSTVIGNGHIRTTKSCRTPTDVYECL